MNLSALLLALKYIEQLLNKSTMTDDLMHEIGECYGIILGQISINKQKIKASETQKVIKEMVQKIETDIQVFFKRIF